MDTSLVSNISVNDTMAAAAGVGDLYARSNLTKLQLLYWVGQQLRPDLPLFTGTLAFTLFGLLDVSRFEQALTAVIEQSDALRMVVHEDNGVPRCHVQPHSSNPLEIVDLSTAENPRQAAEAWLQAKIQKPFDISRQLVKMALLRLSPEEHIWLLNQHHLVTDASSSFLLFECVLKRYHEGDSPHLDSEPQPQFLHYVADERRYWASGASRKAVAYWEEKLSQRVRPLRYFGQTAVKTGNRVLRVTHPLSLEKSAQVKQLANRDHIFALTQEMSLFNVLGALTFALLYRISGAEHLSFMTPVHNRPTASYRQTIGLLMELCPFVVDIEPDETFLSLVNKMRRETRGTMRYYQAGSGLTLQNRVHDVMFNVHQRPDLRFNGQKVDQRLLHPGVGSDSFALHVHDFTDSGQLVLFFDFHQDIFDEAMQQRTIDTFLALLDAVLENDEVPLQQIELGWNLSIPVVDEETPATRGDFVGPRDRLEMQLKRIWEDVLDMTDISIFDNFFDLGGSSFQAMNLFAEIEKLTGRYFSLATLLKNGTIAELADVIRSESGEQQWSSLVEIQKGDPEKRPFFCVHGGGGHVLVFTRLAERIGTDQPFYAFQARGLDGKQQPFRYIEEMAAYYVSVLREYQSEGPYQLGGFSMGGAVAFEMARILHQQGQQVDLLAIIDTPAQSPNLAQIKRVVNRLGQWFKWHPPRRERAFIFIRHRLWLSPSQNFNVIKRSLMRKMKANKGSNGRHPQPTNDQAAQKTEEDRRIQRISAINHTAYYLYVPGHYPGTVTLFRSTNGYDDPYRDTDELAMGWDRVAAKVETFVIPGGHVDVLFDDTSLETMVSSLRSRLA